PAGQRRPGHDTREVDPGRYLAKGQLAVRPGEGILHLGSALAQRHQDEILFPALAQPVTQDGGVVGEPREAAQRYQQRAAAEAGCFFADEPAIGTGLGSLPVERAGNDDDGDVRPGERLAVLERLDLLDEWSMVRAAAYAFVEQRGGKVDALPLRE